MISFVMGKSGVVRKRRAGTGACVCMYLGHTRVSLIKYAMLSTRPVTSHRSVTGIAIVLGSKHGATRTGNVRVINNELGGSYVDKEIL